MNTSYCAASPLQHGLALALDAEDGSFEVSSQLGGAGARGFRDMCPSEDVTPYPISSHLECTLYYSSRSINIT